MGSLKCRAVAPTPIWIYGASTGQAPTQVRASMFNIKAQIIICLCVDVWWVLARGNR